MIGQVQEPIDEILEMLDGEEKIVLYGGASNGKCEADPAQG
jgi:hypothetical protein